MNEKNGRINEESLSSKIEGDSLPTEIDTQVHQTPMALSKHQDITDEVDDGVSVEDSLFNTEDALSSLKMTDEELALSREEISKMQGVIKNLIVEIDSAIDNTIKTNYFEVVKTQREITEVHETVQTCITIINMKKELDALSEEHASMDVDADSELADKISMVNDEVLIGSATYDDLLKDCEALNLKIDTFVTEANAFILSSKENMRKTSLATAGIVEMLNHTIELDKGTLSEEKINQVKAFISIYEARGDISLFEKLTNMDSVAKSVQKFSKVYHKKKKVILRYNKAILGDILEKNNVKLFYTAISTLLANSSGESSGNIEHLHRYIYTICRIIKAQDDVLERLKMKLAILSIFDIYHGVYDYGNEKDIIAILQKLYNEVTIISMRDEIRKIVLSTEFTFNECEKDM